MAFRSLSLATSFNYHLLPRASSKSSLLLKPTCGKKLSNTRITSPRSFDKAIRVSCFLSVRFFSNSQPEFVDMLNEMRFGNLSPKSINMFRSLSRSIEYDDGLGPTELYVRPERNASLVLIFC